MKFFIVFNGKDKYIVEAIGPDDASLRVRRSMPRTELIEPRAEL